MYRFADKSYCGCTQCLSCDENETKLSDVKYWLTYLLEQLYSQDELDLEECERCLQELSATVDMKVPYDQLNIARACKAFYNANPMTKNFNLDAWKKWNNSYLKQLTNQ